MSACTCPTRSGSELTATGFRCHDCYRPIPPTVEATPDMVNHPPHYTAGGMSIPISADMLQDAHYPDLRRIAVALERIADATSALTAAQLQPDPLRVTVQVDRQMLAQLEAAPSEPVRVSIISRPHGEHVMVCTVATLDAARGEGTV